mmetsp:Transcript_29747/g.69331  ORF Transcript_29747/g.69331 Transcript_29747/m.69331 type:complete len:138 (+) Transcript_29747:444-857(+)
MRCVCKWQKSVSEVSRFLGHADCLISQSSKASVQVKKTIQLIPSILKLSCQSGYSGSAKVALRGRACSGQGIFPSHGHHMEIVNNVVGHLRTLHRSQSHPEDYELGSNNLQWCFRRQLLLSLVISTSGRRQNSSQPS